MSLTQLDTESFISISHTKEEEKKEIDYESGYDKRRKKHPPLKYEYSVNVSGTIYWYWTLLVSLAIGYNFFAIPGYVYLIDIESKAYWTCYNLAADVIYLLDILIQSRLAFYEDGCEQIAPDATRNNYFHNQLFFDAFSVCPFELLSGFFPNPPVLRVNRLFKINRLLGLAALARNRINTLIISITRIVVLCTTIFHWNASVYFYIGNYQNKRLKAGLNATFDDDTEWGWPYLPEKVTDVWILESQFQSSVEEFVVDEEREQVLTTLYDKWYNKTVRYSFSSSVKEYVQSFYWSCMTITTLGEQPSPDDSVQSVFETLDTLIGMVVFAGIMGSVGALVGNANRVETDKKQLLDGLKQFMSFRGVDEDMHSRVLRHFADELARGQRMQEAEVKRELPDRVFMAINRFTALLPLAQSSLFRGTGHAFLSDLGRQLISRRLGPGDVLARIGEEQTEMYIVARGQMICETLDGRMEIVGEGRSVGEEGLIWLSPALNHWRKTIYSREYSQVFVLTREKLLEVLEDYPNHEEILQKTAARLVGYSGRMEKFTLTTTERLEQLAGDVEEIQKKIDSYYLHFLKYSRKSKQRLYRLETQVNTCIHELSEGTTIPTM